MVWRGKRGSGNQGRVRCCSCTSWRRSTITVRRSRTVAANRSWPTRAVRRSADSSEIRFSSESPRTTSPITAGMARRANHSFRSGQMARSPIAAKGDGTGPARSATAQARRRSRSRWPPIGAPAARRPGSRHRRRGARRARRPARCWPPTAPGCPAAGAPPAGRRWRRRRRPRRRRSGPASDAGDSRARRRSTGARRTWRTSAFSSASGPPRLPDRSPTTAASAATTPMAAGARRRTSASADPVTWSSPTALDRKSTMSRPMPPVR